MLLAISALGVLMVTNFVDAGSDGFQCSHTDPCQLKGGLSLIRCPELISQNGYLEVQLSVEIGYFQFEWLELPRRSYNGLQCPPTWRVKPGDTINVTLVNRLKDGTHVPGTDTEQNITNLHTHGLHISPLKPQDNVFVIIRPGEEYKYSFKILENHPSGTYWYHAHHHRSTSLQTSGGMAGMLIIEDDPENLAPELRAVSCPENCEHDIALNISPMLVFKMILFGQKDFKDSLRLAPDLEKWLEKNVNQFTVNGMVKPVITLKKNQLTRFRLLHVGFVSPLELLIIDEDKKPAPCYIREIALDGVYLDHPALPRMGQSVLYPGNRKDWLIKCTNMGTFTIYSHPKEEHAPSFAYDTRIPATIATIHVTEQNMLSPVLDFPKSLPPRPDFLEDLRNVVPDHHITVELGGDFTLNREKWTVPPNYRFKVEVDSIVEIQMINTGHTISHPMHFHVNHAQVIGFEPYIGPVAYHQISNPAWELRDMNGELCYYQHKHYVKGATSREFNVTDPLRNHGHYRRWATNTKDSLAYPQAGQWLDTIYSPALSNVTLRMKVDRFTGPMVIHCHIPSDSDMGMMMAVEIVGKGGDLGGANILSGGAAPGSCKKCEWNRFVEMPPNCSQVDERLPSDVVLNLLITLLMTAHSANATITEE